MEKLTADKYLFGIFRIALGFVFFWAFLDKMFGLGYATSPENAIINGGKSTYGFLFYGTADGTFAWLFQPMAGQLWVEILFISGLALIGLALILGIGVRIAGYSGALMMFLMYMASLPLTNNPVIDDHIIYALALIYFAHSGAGKYIGLGSFWTQLDIVKQYPVLE